MNIEMMSIEEKKDITRRIYVEYPRFGNILQEIGKCHKSYRYNLDPDCLVIYGKSGVGKSTLFKRYATNYPREVKKGNTYVPVLYITIPVPATHHTMVKKLLSTMGDPIVERGSTANKTLRLYKYLRDCKTQLIILDELHNFIDKDYYHTVLQNVRDWLKVLLIDTGIPMVVMGLNEAQKIIDTDPQISRRFLRRITLEPFTLKNESGQKEFISFLSALDSLLPLTKRSFLWADEMPQRILAATEGIVGFITALIRYTVELALDRGYDKLELELLAETFDNYEIGVSKRENPFMV